MTARRIAVVAGFVGGVGWVGKILVMTVQGGPDLDSVIETIAFLMGLVGVPVAAAAAAVHLSRGRSGWVRVLSAVAGLVAVALILGLQPALTALPGESWIQAEAVFGLLGLAALTTAIVLARVDKGGRAIA